MIIKFSLLRLSIIFLLVVLFPLVQNQWLNLYLFDIDKFTIYKILYYLSGLLCPVLVCINSLTKFTYYKFNDNKIKNNYREISGKLLLIIIVILIISLSTLITSYIFTNYRTFLNVFNSYNKDIFYFAFDNEIVFILVISILLIFSKTKFILKKIILTNYFIFSIIIWYSQINKILINDSISINNFLKLENLNFINIFLLLLIEAVYYLWSYISYSSNLSDWRVQIPSQREITPVIRIVIFYLLIILYYSIL